MNDFKEVYDKIYPELINIYETDIKKENIKISLKRKKLLKKIIIIDVIIIIIILLLFCIVKVNLFAFIFNILLVMIIISTLIYKFSFSKEKKQISDKFKNNIIKKLINSIYEEECILNIDNGIDENEYNSNIYGDNYNRYYSKDLVYLKENKIFFSEVLVQYRTSGKHQTTTTIFDGIAGQKHLNKNINTNIIILSNRLFMENRVKLDSSEFEKYFDIKCEDKITAVRFLTADIMDMMITLKEKYGCNFELGIIGQVLYFRISTYRDFFEIPESHEGLNLDYLRKNVGILLQIKKLTTLIDDVVKEI